MDPWETTAVAVGGATAAAGAWNAAWLWVHWWNQVGRARQRFAAGVLALLNAGVAVESVASLSLFVSYRAGWEPSPFISPGAWIGARVALLAGTLLLSLLILRKAAR